MGSVKWILLCALVLSGSTPSFSQGEAGPCGIPEARQFDFWLGNWKVEWTSQGGELQQGTNRISRILDGCVIREEFDAPPMQFRGMSHSVYNKLTGKWHQTWVDNTGGYLDFTGEFSDGKMILSRTAGKGDTSFLQRMVWYNIGKDSLDWNWERSDDDGATWAVLWNIRYTRTE